MEAFFIIVPVVVLLIIIGAIFGHRAEKKRVQQLTELATEQGWAFDTSRDKQHRHTFPQFHEFKSGDQSRYAYNRMTGSWSFSSSNETLQLNCLAGDYHYETESTDSDGDTSTTSWHFSYLLVTLPYPAPADLRIRPENWGDKLGAFMGFDDIDFESAEFSKKFHVTSRDKRFAYDLVHPRMMDFLLATRPKAFALDAGWLCITSGDGRWKPEEFKERLAWVSAFLKQWPRHLIPT